MSRFSAPIDNKRLNPSLLPQPSPYLAKSTRVTSNAGKSIADIQWGQMGVGMFGVSASSTFSNLTKRIVVNEALLTQGLKSALTLLSSSSAEAVIATLGLGAPASFALFFIGATAFHVAHKAWTIGIEGQHLGSLRQEFEDYVYGVGMFAFSAGAMGFLKPAAGLASFSAEYGVFTVYESFESTARQVTGPGSDNVNAATLKTAALHAFSAKAMVERLAFTAGMKAGHPLSHIVESHLGKEFTLEQITSRLKDATKFLRDHPMATSVALGGALMTVSGTGHTLNPILTLAATAGMVGIVVGGEKSAPQKPSGPAAFLGEQVLDTWRTAHAPEFLSREALDLIEGMRVAVRGAPETVLGKGKTYQDLVQHLADGSKDFEGLLKVAEYLGEQGLYSVDVPVETGVEGVCGLGLDQRTSVAIWEAVDRNSTRSFENTVGGSSGISMMPLLLFGSLALKARHLPGLIEGKKIGAFALTEPGSGSDAPHGLKTTAALSPDGKTLTLNGQKQFITNGGIADVFTVFVKVDGKPTACLVEMGTPGLEIGKEEIKMGLDDTSTTSLTFTDLQIPVENILGKVGDGFKVMATTLNLGRGKVATTVVGDGKRGFDLTLEYAQTRTQGGKPISEYHAIKKLLAEAGIEIFAAESVVHANAGLADARAEAIGNAKSLETKVKVATEMGTLAGVAKLRSSEGVSHAVDQCVQVFGGYGVIRGFPIEAIHRDLRVTRIYEGSSEIMRTKIIGEGVLRNGNIPTDLGQVMKEHKSKTARLSRETAPEEVTLLIQTAEHAKTLAQYCLGLVAGTPFLKDITLDRKSPLYDTTGQDISMPLADLVTSAYTLDAVAKRIYRGLLELSEKGPVEKAAYENARNMAEVFVNEEFHRMATQAEFLLAHISSFGNFEKLSEARTDITRLSHIPYVNAPALKQKIADYFLERRRYI